MKKRKREMLEISGKIMMKKEIRVPKGKKKIKKNSSASELSKERGLPLVQGKKKKKSVKLGD